MSDEVQGEVQGWIKRVAQLQATLNEGAKIAARVIGSSGPAPIPQSEAVECDCMAARLSQSLERAINDAVELVGQLCRIGEQF